MKHHWLLYLLPFAAGFVALGVGLYFVHPLAPLFLILSLLIQAPIILLLVRASFGSGYRQRADARRAAYQKTGDAEAWLAGELAEARSIGFRHWSRAGRQLSLLNRAEAYVAAGQPVQAAAMLVQLKEDRLTAAQQETVHRLLNETASPGLVFPGDEPNG